MESALAGVFLGAQCRPAHRARHYNQDVSIWSEAVSRLPLTCVLQQTRSHAGDPMTKRLGYSCAAPSTAHSCPSQRLCRGLCKTTHELLKARVTISSQSSSMLMLHSSRSGVQQIRSLRASFILTHNFVLGSISRPPSNEELSVDCQNPAVSRPRSPGACGSSCTCQASDASEDTV